MTITLTKRKAFFLLLILGAVALGASGTILIQEKRLTLPTIPHLVSPLLLGDLEIAGLVVGIVGLVGVIVVGGVALYTVETITHPQHSDPFLPLSPYAFGLPAEEISFPCEGGTHQVRGLYIPAPGATSTILVCPGYRRSLSDILFTCTHLWEAGYSVLAFEYYGHGTPVGTRVTLGYREIADFLGAVAYAKHRAPSHRLGAIGYSMGAAVTLMASARTPLIEAVVADSSFATQWSAVALRVRNTLRLPLPNWMMGLLYRITDLLLGWRAGYRFRQVEPVREIQRIAPRPLLLIHGLKDTVVDPGDAVRLYEAAAEPKTLWLIPDAPHIRGYFGDPVGYTARIVAFFAEHLKQAPARDPFGFPLLFPQSSSGFVASDTFSPLPQEVSQTEEYRVSPLPTQVSSPHMVKQETSWMSLEAAQRPPKQTEPLLSHEENQAFTRQTKRTELRKRQFRRSVRLRYARLRPQATNHFRRLGMACGRLIYRCRWAIIPVWLIALAIILPFAGALSSILHNSGYVIEGSESNRVNTILTTTLHAPVSQLLVVFESQNTPVVALSYQQELQLAVSRLRTVSHVTTITQGGIGKNGRSTFLTVGFDADQDTVAQQIPAFRALLPHEAGDPAHATLTGTPAITNEIQVDTQTDSEHAEMIALPLTLLVLLLVFGTLIAGLMPLILAAVAVPITLASIYAVALHVETNIFVLNIASVLGLGLSIDYSLLLVRRFREELARGRSVPEAVAWTVATAGEAILFSGLIIVVGFAGLFFVGIPVMSSFALGGITVAATAVLAALTLLPALLGVVGTRVNVLRLPPFRLIQGRTTETKKQGNSSTRQSHGFWHTWAMFVTRRPVLMILLVAVILVGLGWPARSLNPGLPGTNALPLSSEARHGLAVLQTQFPEVDPDPIMVLAQTPNGTSMLTAQNVQRLQALSQQISSLPSVAGITSLLTPPSVTGPVVTTQLTQHLLMLYQTGTYQHVPELAPWVASTTQSGTTLLLVHLASNPNSQTAQDLIDHLRALTSQPNIGLRVLVGGSLATTLDFDHTLYDRFARALLFILLATYLLLLVLFRSLVLPLKAILMNILSIGAAYGALVLVFQHGHFQNLLAFSTDGSIDRFIPVLLFCVLFGLSMDYEVFLLSRMQEEWRRSGENRTAVAEGLERTGGMITNAALLFVIVSASFLTTSLVVTKELGLGITVAILVDASLVRAVLVPAAMQLMGRLNWWFPGAAKARQKTLRMQVCARLKRLDGRVLLTPITDEPRTTANLSLEKQTTRSMKSHGDVQESLPTFQHTPSPNQCASTNQLWYPPSMAMPSEPFVYPSYQDWTHPQPPFAGELGEYGQTSPAHAQHNGHMILALQEEE